MARRTKDGEKPKGLDALLGAAGRTASRIYEILDAVPSSVVIVGADGEFAYVNRRAAELYGEDYTGTQFVEHIRSKAKARKPDGTSFPLEETPLVRTVRRGETLHGVELLLENITGEKYPVLLSSSPLYDAKGGIAAAIVTFEEISGRREIEHIKAESERRTGEILESITDAFYAVDSKWNFTYINRKAEQLLKLDRSKLLGKPLWDAFPETVNTMGWKMHHKAMKTRRSVHWEAYSSFFRMWMDVSAYPSQCGGLAVYFRDITRRKKTEAALEESERRFRTIVETAGEGIVMADPSGRWYYVNARMEDILGYTSKELMGKTSAHFVADEWQERISDNRERLKKGDILNGDIKVRRKDGSLLWIRYSASPMSGEAGEHTGNIFMCTDITQSRQYEEELRHKEYLLETVFGGIDDHIFLKDRDSRFVMVNSALARNFKKSADEMRGMRTSELMDEKDAEKIIENDRQVLEKKEAIVFEEAVRLKDGIHTFLSKRVPWTDDAGDVIGLFGISHDITRRKRREEKIERQNAMLEAINSIYDSYVFYETKEELGKACLDVVERITQSGISFAGEIGENGLFSDIAVSTAGEKQCGIIDKSGHKLKLKDLPVAGLYGSLLKSGRTLLVNEICAHPDSAGVPQGHPPLNSFLGVPYLREGAVKGMVAVANRQGGYEQDAKETLEALTPTVMEVLLHKRTEEALKEREKQLRLLVGELEKADKNKNDFIDALSHELRNPLAAVSAGLQLKRITRDEKDDKRADEIISRQMGQLCRLVDDLLDLTRLDRNKIVLRKQRLELGVVVRQAGEDYKPLFYEKKISLIIKIPDEPVYVTADPVRLTQITGNLLQNACKFTDSGGEVVLSLCADGHRAYISVKDSGEGIREELLPVIFEPFMQDETLSGSEGGLGLGLSVVRGIAKLHGGSVCAKSGGKGKGSEFTIRLPLCTQPEQSFIKTKCGQASSRPLKILVIDDNRDFADAMLAVLRALGHEAHAAYDGCMGLRMAQELRPDAVFCDLGLPGMPGTEVAEKIRGSKAINPACLIALTGYAGRATAEKAMSAGFDRHLVKPADIEDVRRMLAEIG